MFIGHLGLAFAAKKVAPRPSLGTLALAAQLVDGVWPVFLLLGWEKVEIVPGITAVTPLLFASYPYTHSLAAGAVWALLLAGGYYLVAPRWRRRGMDRGARAFRTGFWISYRTDPTCRCGQAVRRSVSVCGTRFRRRSPSNSRSSREASGCMSRQRVRATASGTWALAAFVLLLAVLYLAAVFGPPPPSVQVLAMSGILGWLFVVWAYWIDRHRKPVAE